MSTDRTLLKIHKTNIFAIGLIPLFKRFKQNIYPKQIVTACLFAFGLISSLSHAERAESKEPTPMVNHAWGNLYGFHQSRAHYRSGKTYLTWVGLDNHPYVSDYNHKKKEWSVHQRVGTNLISPLDYHGNPSILVDQKGLLHVFYGGHNRHMRYSRSKKPLSNRDWLDFTSYIPYTDSTYPQLFEMSDGTIYCFYRRRTHRGNWTYITTRDNGMTWSKEVHVLDGRSPPGNGWYAAFSKDPNRDHIHLLFLWHASKDNLPDSRRNLYYIQMDHSTRQWTTMENEELTTPLSFEEANDKGMVFDSKNKYSSIPQLWLTADGRPVGLNRISDKDGVITRHLHVWTGEAWQSQKVPIDAILKPTQKKWIGFRSRSGTVQKFTSSDEGTHWIPGEIILKTEGEQKLNALFANAHPDAVLAIIDQVDAKRIPGKQRLWIWGQSGFLK